MIIKLDRVGVYICLEALAKYDNIKIAFFVEEEIGMKGSSAADMKFFSDVMFVFEPDRRGNNEVINNTNGTDVFGDEFHEYIKSFMEEYNYKIGSGTATDIGVLAKNGLGVVSLNIGCGYYDAHSKEEKVCLTDVENCMNLLFKITDKSIADNKRHEFVPPKKVYATTYGGIGYGSSNYSSRYNQNYYDEYDDYEGYRSYGNYYGRTKKKDLKVRKLSKDEEEIVKLTTSAKYWNLFKEQN